MKKKKYKKKKKEDSNNLGLGRLFLFKRKGEKYGLNVILEFKLLVSLYLAFEILRLLNAHPFIRSTCFVSCSLFFAHVNIRILLEESYE